MVVGGGEWGGGGGGGVQKMGQFSAPFRKCATFPL